MATLKNLVDETTNIKNEIVECYSKLSSILTSKNIEVSEEDKMLDLISKVDSELINKLWLYKDGYEYIENGGIISYNALTSYPLGTMAKQSSNILVTQVGSQTGNLIKSNKIDLTPYSKLHIKLKSNAFNSGTTDYYLPTLCVFNNNNDGAAVIYKRSVYSTSIQTVTLDISSLNASYLVGVQSMGSTYELYEMWLEK